MRPKLVADRRSPLGSIDRLPPLRLPTDCGLLEADIKEHFRKTQSLRELFAREKKKRTTVKVGCGFGRDVSHLKDAYDPLATPGLFSLPTTVEGLQELYDAPEQLSPRKVLVGHTGGRLDGSEYLPFLGAPTGRQEIAILTQWLHLMTDKYASQASAQHLIYKMCLRELVRQVTVQCIERGNLLKEVIDALETWHDQQYQSHAEQHAAAIQQFEQELVTHRSEFASQQAAAQAQLTEVEHQLLTCRAKLNIKKEELKATEEVLNTAQFTIQTVTGKNTAKSVAAELLLSSLHSHHVAVHPHLVECLRDEGDVQKLPSEEAVILPEPMTSTVCDKHTQTEEPPKFKWRSRSQLGHQEMSGTVEKLSVKPCPFERQRAHSCVPVMSVRKPFTSAAELYGKLRTSLEKEYSPECHFQSWQKGVITGLKKGRKVGFAEAALVHEVLTPTLGTVHSSETEKDTVHEGATDHEESDQELYSHRRGFSEGPRSYRKTHRRGGSTRKRSLIRKSISSRATLRAFSARPRRRKTVVPFLESARSPSKTTRFVEFNWHRHRRNFRVTRRLNLGNWLLLNLMRKPLDAIKKKGSFSARMANKLIASIYTACSGGLLGVDLAEVTYDQFLKRYGLRAVADHKFIDLLSSVLKAPQGRRLTFLRFMGAGSMLGVTDFSQHSLKLFLSAYKYMLGSRVGVHAPVEDCLVPVVRAIECTRDKSEKYLDKQTVQQVLTWIEQNNVPDIKKVNASGMVGLDSFLQRLVSAYEEQQATVQAAAADLFHAVALGASVLEPAEAALLTRFIHTSLPAVDPGPWTLKTFANYCLTEKRLSVARAKHILGCGQQEGSSSEEDQTELAATLAELKLRSDWTGQVAALLECKLVALKNSQGLFKDATLELGWTVCSAEVQRIKDEVID